MRQTRTVTETSDKTGHQFKHHPSDTASPAGGGSNVRDVPQVPKLKTIQRVPAKAATKIKAGVFNAPASMRNKI